MMGPDPAYPAAAMEEHSWEPSPIKGTWTRYGDSRPGPFKETSYPQQLFPTPEPTPAPPARPKPEAKELAIKERKAEKFKEHVKRRREKDMGCQAFCYNKDLG